MVMVYRERQVSASDGLALYVRDYGDEYAGRTVLCLGGLTRNSKDFHTLACRLKDDCRIIAPDYRGRGRSAYDPDWHHYDPRIYLDDIRQITTALGVHAFAVIGTSLGGIMGMILGVAMPTSIRGALLNDVSPVIPRDGMGNIVNYMKNTAPLPDWTTAVSHLQDTFPDFPAKTPEDWQTIAEATYRENDNGNLVFDWDPAIVRNVEEQDTSAIDLWPYFRSLRRHPVLSVRGALSPFVPDGVWQDMATACPGMVQVEVPGVGHAPSLKEPEATAPLDTWLARCFT